MDRREMLALAGAGLVGGGLLAGCEETAGKENEARSGKKSICFDNAFFYENGKFQPEKAKDAHVALMKYHGYPVYPDIRKNLWVSDYGTGQFAKLGLGAVMWMNNEKDRYMLMDVFLLPGQMLPEHWHLKTEKNPAKLEGWLVRFGSSHIVGIGEDNLSKDIVIPACHMNGQVTVRHEVFAKPGDFVPLKEVESRHWQFGGPEGAIITEVANVHDGSGVRHSDKACNDNFVGK
jgi:D-lyxose ketol-isomerase